MRGLNKLRKCVGRNIYTIITSNELMEIADEIEQDMEENSFYASFERFAKSIGKPIEDSPILNIRKWLDYWYLPRPVVDGEPVHFGDELMLELYPKELKTRHKFKAESIQFCNDGNTYIDGFEKKRCERVQSDSIEKLKTDMLYVLEDDPNIPDAIVDEWLSRAEKLFKGNCND